MKVFDYESRARLQRMRNHMAMDKLAKIERGRYGWTHYSKGSKADDEMSALLERIRRRERETAEP